MHKRRNQGVLLVKVRDGMSHLVLTIGPAHTLRQAAHMMSARRIGAAVVIDPEHAGIGILTERDILDSVAAGEDPDAELAAQHRTEDLTYASPDWTLEQAAAAMVKGGFRHLVVVEDHDVAGLLSMRDIVRCWTSAEAAQAGRAAAASPPRPDPRGRSRSGEADCPRSVRRCSRDDGHLGHEPRGRGNLPAVAGRGRDARLAGACPGSPAAGASGRTHDDGGGAGTGRGRSPRPGHRRGDPDRLQPGRERAATPRPDEPGLQCDRGSGRWAVQSRSVPSGPHAWAGRPGAHPAIRGDRLPSTGACRRPRRAASRPWMTLTRQRRPVRPGRADGPVPRGGHQRRAVPHVVRADRLGRAVLRGVGTCAPRHCSRAWPAVPRLIPFDQFTVTDDRGARYSLDSRRAATPSGPARSAWARPAARTSAGWTSPPRSQAVRVDLRPDGPATRRATSRQVSDIKLSPGEHLLRHAGGAAAHRGAGSRAARGGRRPRGPARGPWRPGSATSSPRSRRPTYCHRSARSRPGSPRCAPAWTSGHGITTWRPRPTCRNPGSAC